MCTGIGRVPAVERPTRQEAFHVDGILDVDGLLDLERRCRGELDRGTIMLVLDFTRMTACPAALFTTVSRLSKTFRRNAGQLHLVGLSDAVCSIVAG